MKNYEATEAGLKLLMEDMEKLTQYYSRGSIDFIKSSQTDAQLMLSMIQRLVEMTRESAEVREIVPIMMTI